MPYSAHHPDDEALRLYAVGNLTESQGDEIEKHLADCEACSHRLDEIERKKSDPFIREMKAAESEPSGDFNADSLLFDKRYRLEKLLGRGGMGEAWKAFDDTSKRHVVLKFVPKDIQNVNEAMGAVLDSFGRVEKLQHQHICPLYSLDNDPEHGFFLVMKFIDGLPLNAYCRRYAEIHEPIPFDEIIRILRDVADALDYAHSRKVIHRDVKPANIMVGETDGVQLIDFGLADEIRASLTQTVDVSVAKNTAKISGTRSYMAPEQWEGRKQDARTDQYALAVTAYELLSGHVPFSGADTEILKNAVLHNQPSPILDMPDYVNAALFKGLAKNRNDRFKNCRDFVEALAKESQPPRLPPPLPTITKPTAWNWFTPALILSVLLFAVLAFFLIRQSLKSEIGDTANIKSIEKVDNTVENVQPIDVIKPIEPSPSIDTTKLPTKEDFDLSKYLAVQRNQRSGLRKVMRVTLIIEENALGRLLVKRGLSAEPLPSFKGTRFDSHSFPDSLAFHGDNHAIRYLFPNGDMSRQTTGSVLPGWEYWYSGGSYDIQHEKTRFSLQRHEERAGFIIGKEGSGLPCAVTYEILDNKDDPPHFEVVLYKNKSIDCTLTCWGEKDESGRLRMSATYSRPFENDPVFLANDVIVEDQMSLFKQFKLPTETQGKIDMVKYGLWVRRSTGLKGQAGFDLTLFDMVGRFESDVGEW